MNLNEFEKAMQSTEAAQSQPHQSKEDAEMATVPENVNLADYYTLKWCMDCQEGVHAWVTGCTDVECPQHTRRANALQRG